MKTRKTGFVYWAPRVLGILMVLFVALFSFDVFDMDASLSERIGGFLIHNIPSFLLILLLVVSWRRELVGTVIYPLLGLTYSLANLDGHWSVHAAITGPLVLIGLLFLLSWREKQRTASAV
ncbi:MAG: hypothetical protein GYA15_10335 [Leptolinea sp.]|jgi:hypothetical protein|nr:hypothetical protein [Leptolinea sp.]